MKPEPQKSQSAPPTKEPTALEAFAQAIAPPADDTAPPADDGGDKDEKGAARTYWGGLKEKPKDLAALAASLGADAKELYALEVPSAREGGEAFTLGKLKDLAAEHDAFAVQRLEHEEATRKRQSEFMRAEQELTELFATLPPDAIKPEVRAKLQARRDAAMIQERQRVLAAIPEWKDATVRTQEIESLVEHLKDYGFPETYLSTVFDHRTLRYIRENWKREQQIRRALEKVAERKPSTPPKSKPGQPSASKRSGNGMLTHEQQQAGKFGNTILNAGR